MDGGSEAAGSGSGARRAERRAVREWNVGVARLKRGALAE